MSWPLRKLLLVLAVFFGDGLAGTKAWAQGWDYGRQMFGFAQYGPSTGWSSYYHPGDGRRGTFYVDAGNGNFYGDPKARPLGPVVPAPLYVPRHRHPALHWLAVRRR